MMTNVYVRKFNAAIGKIIKDSSLPFTLLPVYEFTEKGDVIPSEDGIHYAVRFNSLNSREEATDLFIPGRLHCYYAANRFPLD